MKNRKLRLKLLLPHIFILALLVLGLIANFISLNNIKKQTEALYDGPFAIKTVAGTVEETLEAMQTSTYRAISNGSREITDTAILEARNRAVVLQEQIAQLKQYALGNMSALSRLESNLSELSPMQEHVLALAAQNNDSEASAYMESSNVPVINEAQRELARYLQSVDAKERELVTTLRQTHRKAVIFLIVLGAVGAAFAVRDGRYFWRLGKDSRKTANYSSTQMK